MRWLAKHPHCAQNDCRRILSEIACHPEDGGKIRAAFATQPLSVMVALRQSSLKEERSHFPSYRNRREERKCTNRFRDWRMSRESV